jgi:hypothetical protein
MAASDGARFRPYSPGGEKFFRWIKSCKEKRVWSCLKKFTIHKTLVKSGENVFLKTVAEVGTAVAKASASANHNRKRLDSICLRVAGKTEVARAAHVGPSAVETIINHEKN